MHANVTTDKGGGGGGSWRLPPDETLQVGDSKSKDDVNNTKHAFRHCLMRRLRAPNGFNFALFLQDLGYPSEGHNWRSIIFSLLVINFVIAGIVTAIYLLG